MLAVIPLAAFAEPLPRTGSSGFKEIWEREFMFKPVVGLDDRRAHVDTWFLGGYEHRTSMLAVLLSDHILTHFDNEYIFRAELPLYYFQKRAVELKGEELSEEESWAIKVLFRRCAARHPTGRTFAYAFLPIFLQKTMGRTQDCAKALEMIALGDGCICDYGVAETPTQAQVLQLLNEGCAVILERKGRHNPFTNDDGRWHLVFGAFPSQETGEHIQFLVNVPEETTLMERYWWKEGPTHPSLESINLGSIYEAYSRRCKGTGYVEIRSNIDNMICNNGFLCATGAFSKDFRVHAIRNWRRSAEAWDGELRKILGLPKERKERPTPMPGFAAPSRELWQYYFAEHRAGAGLSFEGSLIPKWHLAAGRFSPLVAALLSSVATERSDFVGFGLSHPGRLFHTARLFLGNSLFLPTQAELDKCKALDEEMLAKYKAVYGELPREPYYWDTPGYSEDYMNRNHPDYKSPHSLQEHVFHSLPQILDGAGNVQEAVDRMGPACAWTARVEGGPGTDWETVKLAVWRRIPVILEGRDGDWRIAVAYLVHDGRRLLLATRRQDGTETPPEPVLKEYELPDELPAELEFIEYDEARWTPWFVHHFEPTVEHLAPRIVEIFQAHPEAREYLHAHPELRDANRADDGKGTD